MEREIRKCLTFVIRQIASKIFGKIILKPGNFEKTQVHLASPNRHKFYSASYNVFLET